MRLQKDLMIGYIKIIIMVLHDVVSNISFDESIRISFPEREHCWIHRGLIKIDIWSHWNTKL